MKKIDATLTRIQNYFGAKTRKAMMENWGIPENTLKTWVSKDKIPEKRLGELAEREGLNLEWLQTGDSPKYKVEKLDKPMFINDEIAKELDAYVAEAMPNYGKNPNTVKLCKVFDALDDKDKEEVLKEILPFILKKF